MKQSEINFDIVHDRENSEETEKHLQQNRKKFAGDCRFLLNLLEQGAKLNARQVERDYNMDGRRLREIHAADKRVQKEWVVKKGETKYVQYFI